MYQFKLFLKSKEFIFSFLILTILTVYNIYNYFDQALIFNKHVYEGVNAFSFWKYIRTYNIGSIIIFITPIIIIINSLTLFSENMTGSVLSARLLKEKYNMLLKKQILNAYIRSFITPLLLSIIILIIGLLVFPHIVPVESYGDPLLDFFDEGITNPLLYVLSSMPLLIIYCFVITNFGLIAFKLTRKLNISIILGFVLINIVNIIVGNIGTFIAKILPNIKVLQHFYTINIYEGYSVHSTILNGYINTIIYFFISAYIVHRLYKIKESMVLEFE